MIDSSVADALLKNEGYEVFCLTMQVTNSEEVAKAARDLHREAEAIVTPIDTDKMNVRFTEPQIAVTPGQAAVFYEDDMVTGGGTIERVLN